jgi:hypothetical protein
MDNTDKILKTVILSGQNTEAIKRASERMIKPHLQENEEISVVSCDLENMEEIKAMIQRSSLFVAVLNRAGISSEKIKSLIEVMEGKGFLLVSSEQGTIGELEESDSINSLSFGFQPGSDFYASDVKINGGINFKMNHSGKSVPIWLEKEKWEGKLDSVLASVALATVFGLNLVEISEALKTPDKQ